MTGINEPLCIEVSGEDGLPPCDVSPAESMRDIEREAPLFAPIPDERPRRPRIQGVDWIPQREGLALVSEYGEEHEVLFGGPQGNRIAYILSGTAQLEIGSRAHVCDDDSGFEAIVVSVQHQTLVRVRQP